MKSKLAVIGLGGVSCGGKTTLAVGLKEKLQFLPSIDRVSVLHQDDFYKDEETLLRENVAFDEELRYHNWELEECFYGDRFRREFRRLFEGGSGEIGSDVAGGSGESGGNAVIILEGILLLEDAFISEKMTRRYFLDLPKEECHRRRMKRTYEPPEPDRYFDLYYWPSFLDLKRNVERRVEEKENFQVTFLDSNHESYDDLLTTILEDVSQYFLTI